MASLENRGGGSWRVTISNGYNPDGSKRRLQRTIKIDPTKTENAQRKEVEKQAAALETDYRRHLIADGKKITISALADEFMTYHGNSWPSPPPPITNTCWTGGLCLNLGKSMCRICPLGI